MAFEKITALNSPIAALDDRVTGQAATLKAYFDANPEQIRAALNALIDALCAADAAEQIGFTPTTRIDADNVQDAIEAVDANMQSIVGGLIPNQSVTTARLADGAVTEAKIAGGAVSAGKLADNAVTAGKIAAGVVEESKLSAAVQEKISGMVGTARLADRAVTEAKIADGAVTEDKLGADVAQALTAWQYNGVSSSEPTISLTLVDRTEYTLVGVAALNVTYPAGAFESWLDITTAAEGTITLTLPESAQYACDMPELEAGKRYEMSVKNGVVIAVEVTGA